VEHSSLVQLDERAEEPRELTVAGGLLSVLDVFDRTRPKLDTHECIDLAIVKPYTQ
jgi:hypothetical protein